jgi:predicted ATPase
MRIVELGFKNHPILGNLQLDFKDTTGKAAPIVILCGENGTGKSKILDEIFTLLSAKDAPKWKYIDPVKVELSTSDLEKANGHLYANSHVVLTGDALIQAHDPTNAGHSHGALLITTSPGSTLSINRAAAVNTTSYSDGKTTREALPVMSALFSEVSPIMQIAGSKGVKTSELDKTVTSTRQPSAIVDAVNQTLINLRTQDAADIQSYVENNLGQPVPPSIINQRSKRFNEAIQYFAPDLALVGHTTRLLAEFERGGARFDINALSSGERQILTRMSFLLTDIAESKNSVVIFDEPETGLHPAWQEKVLPFLSSITKGEAKDFGQIIVSTHSPNIVHNTLNAKVILLERQSGSIVVANNPAFPAPTSDELVKTLSLQNLRNSLTSRSILNVLVEGKTDARILKNAHTHFSRGRGEMNFISANGDKNLQALIKIAKDIESLNTKPCVALFDFDSAYNQWKGLTTQDGWHETDTNDADGLTRRLAGLRIHAMLLPIPPHRTDYANSAIGGDSRLTTELLFEDPDLNGYATFKKLPGSVALLQVPDKKKADFSEETDKFNAAQFVHFEKLIEHFYALAQRT